MKGSQTGPHVSGNWEAKMHTDASASLECAEANRRHLNTYKVLNPHIRRHNLNCHHENSQTTIFKSQQAGRREQLLIPVLVEIIVLNANVFSTASHIRITPPLYGVYISFMALAGQFYLWVCNLNCSQKHIYLTEMSWCPCIIFQLHFELIGFCIGSTYISK